MGIAPYKTFTFDGESSANYGVYITGEGVFNAPKRAVEMIEIPNRNGTYALDTGRFENVEVKYKIGIVDDSETDFADRVSDFRNWLCSKVGYCRLEDEYNPDEYRMAVYASGIEIDHDFLIAGEAEITFNCKPQRWLKSGETATSVADGGTLTNPTRFDASPLLEVKGYGNIDIGGQDIDIDNVPIGEIVLASPETKANVASFAKTIDVTKLNTSDEIYINNSQIKFSIKGNPSPRYTATFVTTSIANETNCSAIFEGNYLVIVPDNLTCQKGTSSSVSFSMNYDVKIMDWQTSTQTTPTRTLTGSVSYDGNNTVTYSFSNNHVHDGYQSRYITSPEISGDSTASALGDPMYIDLDIGEAWNEDSGTPVSVNNAVSFGAELPVLPSQSTTTITYDNTITDLKIAPRWWRV